jgi:hypothetical protein
LTYVRSSWGNAASEIDEAAVKQVRRAVKERTEPWTVEDLQ